jgi:lipopolysaccharide biosynthesis protein
VLGGNKSGARKKTALFRLLHVRVLTSAPMSRMSITRGGLRRENRKRLLFLVVGLYTCLRYLTKQRIAPLPSIAFFLQLGQTLHSDYIGECLDNVIKAQRGDFGFDFDITLYLSITDEVADSEAVISKFSRGIPIERVHISRVPNIGFDIGPFLHQLDGQGVQKHDYFLKMHSKSDVIWLERGIESLCGTPRQVISILRAFESLSTVDIVAPMGLAYAMQSSKESLFPHVREKYYQTSEIASTFDYATIEKMQELCLMMGTTACSGFDKYLLSIVSGSMFWARNSDIFYKYLPSLLALHDFRKGLANKYVDNGSFEHALERLVPSMVRFRGRDIVQIQPAPKPIALFFPQFHAIPENDKNWGKGFTEWNLLNQTDFIAKVPLPYAEGGLGYYDLLEKKIRARQAQIARRYGIFGFCYYHYWFSGEGAPKSHKVMYRAIEKMLLDGEPDLPFMLSWANEPWVRTWTGVAQADGTLISQEYGDSEEWKAHFEYLLRFFRHPNYIKVRNKPVFAIYRLGHLKEKLAPMILLWRTLAREYGLPGIHVVETINHFSLSGVDPRFEAEGLIDSSFRFNFGNAASTDNLPSMSSKSIPQYWGIYNGFDRRPRTGDYNYTMLKTPNEFVMWYKTMIERLGQLPGRQIDQGFNFVCAWNEWNEQAVLEPDSRWEFQALKGISKVLQEVPVQPIF